MDLHALEVLVQEEDSGAEWFKVTSDSISFSEHEVSLFLKIGFCKYCLFWLNTTYFPYLIRFKSFR